MPDFGRASHASYLVELPESSPEYPALAWTCRGATMLNVYFEVRKDALLDRLPPEFGRTSPAYCRLSIIDHPESPVGSFREAILALGCRLNMMPAAFVAASITDNDQALAAGLFERGFPNRTGRIEFDAVGDQARAALSDERGPLLEVVMPLLQTVEPNRLAYDHVDALRTLEGGAKTELGVTSPDLAIERAAICKNARIEYPDRSDSVWQQLNCRNVISAQRVFGTRTWAAAHRPG